MKKFYTLGLALCMSFIGLSASAQDSPLTWGVKAGVNLSNSSMDVGGLDKKAKIGFKIGVTADYAITNDFYLQSGLSFTTKGGKIEAKVLTEKATISINQLYLQLPIMAAYKLEVSPGTKIVINAGPYLAYGIGGKIKIDGTSGVDLSDLPFREMDTFDDNGLKKFDFGLGAGVGAEFGSIVVGLNYELGLTNISGGTSDYKNRNASLTLGYRF